MVLESHGKKLVHLNKIAERMPTGKTVAYYDVAVFQNDPQ
jgi:hypothetical protein